ncbi:ABC transporter permease [Demetria terragena]|uniref:ABC transporter permease n=1 Tax=Demetria terragena TaxID=63959 RepID=UPI00037DD510|nr:ABC transporter permease [Demetria terragena]
MTSQMLQVRVEARRMYRRPACALVLVLAAAFPLLPLLLAAVGSTQTVLGSQEVTAFAESSGLSFTTFTFLLAGQLVVPTVAAYFFGESLARDAEWGSLRSLIVAGASRGRILEVKALCAAAATGVVIVGCAVTTLAVGVLFYGSGSLDAPGNSSIAFGPGVGRVGLMVLTMLLCNLWIAALAFLLSAWSHGNPLTAVGGPLMVLLISHLLGTFPGLGYARDFLPTRSHGTWMVWAYDPVPTDILSWGVFVSVLYAALFGIAAVVAFQTRDISA